MSDNDAWDADDYEPPAAGAKEAAATDKWDGEDEDDDIKDAWDADSDEDKSEKTAEASTAKAPSKKKKLRSKIALKEAQMAQEAEDDSLKSPEDKMAEKLPAPEAGRNRQFSSYQRHVR